MLRRFSAAMIGQLLAFMGAVASCNLDNGSGKDTDAASTKGSSSGSDTGTDIGNGREIGLQLSCGWTSSTEFGCAGKYDDPSRLPKSALNFDLVDANGKALDLKFYLLTIRRDQDTYTMSGKLHENPPAGWHVVVSAVAERIWRYEVPPEAFAEKGKWDPQNKTKVTLSTQDLTPVTITAVVSGKCLTVEGASTDNGAVLVQAACAGADHQRFFLNASSDGSMAIKTFADKCIEAQNGSPDDWTQLLQATCNGAASQTFTLAPQVDGSTLILTMHKKCFDVKGMQVTDDTPIIQFTCSGRDNQSFTIGP